MAGARLSHTATRLPDGQVLAAGGYNRSAELYDPVTGTWSRTADALDTHTSATATLLPSGKVLVAGLGGNGISAEVYDAATSTWAATGSLLTPRIYHTATLLPDGRVLAVGGANGEPGGEVLATAEVYEPATGTWTLTGSMGAARQNHTATLLSNGKVLVTGGTGTTGALQNSAELYDPSTGAWSPVAAMSVARTYHSATLLPNGHVLVVGGGGMSQDKSASAELFDPATSTWNTTGNMAKPRRYHSATLLPTNQVLVTGGFHELTGILTSAELYDPNNGTWRSAGAMAVARYQHTATLMEGGRILVAGGVSNGDQASAELYTPFFTPDPGEPVGPPIEPMGTSLLVQVVNPSGTPIAGATVSVAGSERTTDSAGNALFEGIATGSVVAQVRASGFATGTVVTNLEPGSHGGAVATLKPLNPPIPFNADEDATIVTKQVQVQIPAGSLVDENGQPVTGTAEIAFAPIDPTTNDIESAPGPLVGVSSADGKSEELVSGFMAEIVLTQNGRPLQLAPGAKASINFTLPAAFAESVAPGDLIPAWWFDAEAGVWREDGMGFVKESPTEPGKLIWTTEVSHFTPWNCDISWSWWWRRWWWWSGPACANVLVTDQYGTPLPGRTITARGLDYWSWNTAVTSSTGRACMPLMTWRTAQITVGPWWAPQASAIVSPTTRATCGGSGCTSVTLRVTIPCGAPGTTQTCAYSGPSGTNGVGICKAGYRVCNGYTWGSCTGQVTPSAEICGNTTDENCNGRLNDGCPPPVCPSGSTRACYSGPAGTSGVGICKAGTQTCGSGGWGPCTGQVTPSSERCGNALDDDCDGARDEGCVCVPGDTRTCYNGPAGTSGVGVCKSGTQTCYTSGSSPFWGAACVGEVQPTSEICDGRDNDCDGSVDEGNPGSGTSCSTGRPGVCSAGTTTCSGGALVCTATTSPSPETCDGRDNNCDGTVDEDNPGGGTSCSTSRPGVCSAGTTTCSGGTFVCTATTSPSPETCDGRDNNCDGKTDEGNPGGGTTCSTGQPGVCSAGTTTCSGGAIVCTAKVSPSTEVCGDSLDNDCDGTIDEDCTGGTFSFPYSASNTNSATQNTVDRTVTLRVGQTIIVGTCNITGASGTGDTYLRLFGPSGSLAAENDDYCSAAGSSYLTYTVPIGAAGTYVIKAGCWDTTSCSGTVVYSF